MAKTSAPVKGKASKIKAAVSSVLDPEIKKTVVTASFEPVKVVKPVKKEKAAVLEQDAAAGKKSGAAKSPPQPVKQEAPKKAATAPKTAGADKKEEGVKKPFAGLDPASFFKGWENLWKDNVLLKDLWKSGMVMFQSTAKMPEQPASWGKCPVGFDPSAFFKGFGDAWKGSDQFKNFWKSRFEMLQRPLAGADKLPFAGKPLASFDPSILFKCFGETGWGNVAANDLWEYGVDMIQRQILFWDVMRQRGDNFLQHIKEGEPPVLQFKYETILDGRTLENPVNYALLRIIPEEGMNIDPKKRPFVIVDPRAGHGPGIGGSKQESQVGVALQAGHPAYFVMFFPKPEPGQTLNDVGHAEHLFLQEVIRRHPEAAKPCVMGNCQAGWAVAALAAVDPDIMGTIILNGAPMSYWAGYKNKNPMRYSGGLLGGKWLTTMTCDLGNGIFDGSYLVQNFENLNPANTLFAKEYNLYAKIDTEAERYLHFEEWWSGFFLMNAEEIDSIVTNLFIGNKLARGGITTPDGQRINLKNIKCPIVIFASFGDNITPPQQALNWIVDVYGSDEAILKDGQVIIYTLHPDVGHLGIFVGTSIAKKQHTEFITTLDMIDDLPPGLYEMIIEKKNPFTERGELIHGDYTVRFEMRKLSDIMDLNDSHRDDDYFASVAEVSDFNDELYRTFLQPWIRMISTEKSAEMLRWLNKSRRKYYLFSEQVNPFMATFKIWADMVRKNRKPMQDSNYFLTMERDMAQTIEDRLNGYRDSRDDRYRNMFKAMYGPLGLAPLFPGKKAQIMEEENEAQEAAIHAEIERLKNEMDKGGFHEALIRLIMASMIHIGAIDYRSSLIAKQLKKRYQGEEIKPEVFKKMLWEQYFMLLIDEDRAIASLAKLLPTKKEREEAVKLTMEVMMISDAEIDPNSSLAAKVAKALNLDIKKSFDVAS